MKNNYKSETDLYMLMKKYLTEMVKLLDSAAVVTNMGWVWVWHCSSLISGSTVYAVYDQV